VEPVLAQPAPADRVGVEGAASRPERRRARRLWLVLLALASLAGVGAVVFELRTSTLQARRLSALARELGFRVEAGPSPTPYVPEGGPYDIRLGYARLPGFVERAQAAGFRVDGQARLSPRSKEILSWGLFPIYREKTRAGLRLLDQRGRPLYEARYPERVYERFEAIPPLVVKTLLFVEDRELLDPRHPHRNPAVDWGRLARALGVKALTLVGQERREIGASTLATQIEKFRHSADGRTHSVTEKLRQMSSASLRAYRDGPDTTATRRQIVVDYLDSMPLAAAPGHGEVHGLGDALWVWYGGDFAEVNRVLSDPSVQPGASQAAAYRQVLSLILAARRPYDYLVENRRALEELSDSYLRLMAQAGVMDAGLRDAALAERLGDPASGAPPSVAFTERKAASLVRARLATLLGAPTLYDLDRLDLTVESSLDGPTQDAVSRLLQSLRDPAAVAARGLRGFRLLERGDPSRVIYSVTLYERGPGGNRVRVQTDSFDQPLDINAGARIDLGSTAKLRTLISYLEAIAALHARYAGLAAPELRSVEVHRRDRLSAWAIDHLARHRDRGLAPMLEAAMERRYPADPAQAFFTGGGLQTFHNFDPKDDARVLSVREGFRNSVNLVFIRLMRDLVDHHLFQVPGSIGRVLEDPADARREAYLARFADREGSEFVRRFYRKYQGKTPEEALDILLGGVRAAPHALAAAVRSVHPEITVEALGALLAVRLPGVDLSAGVIADLHARYGPDRYPLIDRGYIARVHPLELWLVGHLRRQPGAGLSEVLGASAAERQAVYGWLFRTRHRNAQDQRIASLIELEAFLELHRGWQRLGYPFASLTPSLATAIGSSGDRPAALAELMGIIVDGGIRSPTVLVEGMHFGAGTPYETRLGRAPAEGRRVLAPEVAAAVRGALTDVVEQGTARSLGEALRREAGGPRVVGGKTGTGDHRYETYGPRGRLIESRVVSRAATFVFMIDDRFFGTVTAYVPGPGARQYEFTSALPVRLLRILLPVLAPLLDSPAPATASGARTGAGSAPGTPGS
jgi:membrane peptidoglycan carboxypeptidase